MGHRPHRRRLRGGRPADAGGRARRLRDRCVRPPARPVLVARDQSARGRLGRQPREPDALRLRVLEAMREAVGDQFLIGIRMTGDERLGQGSEARGGLRDRPPLAAAGLIDFINVIRGHIDSDNALLDVIPIMGMPSAPHLDFAGEIARPRACRCSTPPASRRRHRPPRNRRGQARHGRHDPGAHRRPAHRQEDQGRQGAHDPAVCGRHLLPGPHLRGQRGLVHPQRRHRPRGLDASHRGGRRAAAQEWCGRCRPGRPRGRARVGRARARRRPVRGDRAGRRADPPGVALAAPARADRHRRLARRAAGRGRGQLHFSSWAEADDVLGLEPDVVFVATGGIPNTDVLESARISSSRAGTCSPGR